MRKEEKDALIEASYDALLALGKGSKRAKTRAQREAHKAPFKKRSQAGNSRRSVLRMKDTEAELACYKQLA